ncbi:pentatricopeptide repeat-containing protein At3g02330, mitochondrial [Rhodamnia argentea]|uniref:Pentatricopeptide repeat-containing protein At3g02330, mitochondrial n=1 Tax=Rhodamnia argentea TaxID=178133 RepID=A0A8B8QNY9_9MYRT|nr:pentatricopeptide repeat-containing protein At3g02330, mitochondrial [Rhodamnia argentea]
MALRFSSSPHFHVTVRSLLTLFSQPSRSALQVLRCSTVAVAPRLSARRKTFSHLFQDCSSQKALGPGKQSHACMIVTGFSPTVFVTNCLIQMYIKCSSLDYALKVFNRMPLRDTFSWNAVIFGYAGSGNMAAAEALFQSMPEKDVVSWNSVVSGFLQNGDSWKAVGVFMQMRGAGVALDYTTLAVVSKVCCCLEDLNLGIQIHGLAVKMGVHENVVVACALINMYAKCKKLDRSLQLFAEMPERNWVSWSAVIAGCVQNNQLIEGLEIYREMLRAGCAVSQSTYASVFRSCAGLSALGIGTQLHGHALKSDFGADIVVATATLDMYAKCDNMEHARKLFTSMPDRSLQSYNAIIVGYVRSGQGFEAFHLFRNLQKSGQGFDEISLSGALSACAIIKGLFEGLQIHSVTIKSTLNNNICVANALLDMYGKCRALSEACCVFDEMTLRDAVSWNAVIAAHEQNENVKETLMLFASMLRSRMEPDEFTYGSVLKACAGSQALSCGMEIHNRVIKSGMGLNWFVGSALVDMYSKCGMIEVAEKIHFRTEEQTMVSWNAIISGFVMQKQSEDAQRYFSWMLEIGIVPDSFTYATVLDTCANLATVGLGKQIHAQILKLELQADVYICSTLVDMYSKCGNLKDSQLMFEKAPKRDFVTWNAMICGYAHHGLGEEALQVFERMQVENVKPNHATFVSVLRACAHMGLAEEGLQYFHSMQPAYGLDPQLEHYSCMVDILGRSGRVDDALKLIYSMSFEADAVIWRSLLSTCCDHGNVEIAEVAANSLLQLEPEDSSAYVLLSNLYANSGMWKEVSEMRKVMKNNKLRKEPGCSWIEVKDEVHTFLVGERAHPRSREIYRKLDLLINEMKGSGYVPVANFLLDEEAEETESEEELRINVHP